MQNSDENIWGLIAWMLSIIGAIIVLVIRPNSKYAKFWAYLSVSFFIIIIIGYAIVFIVDSILNLIYFIGPILSNIINILYFLTVLIVWIVGILKSASSTFWKPIYIYDFAVKLGIEKI